MKKSVDESKIQTSVSVDGELWMDFRVALLRRLREKSISHGLELLITQWLKSPSTAAGEGAPEEITKAQQILTRILTRAPKRLKDDVLGNLARWNRLIDDNGTDEGQANRPASRNKPRLPGKGHRSLKLISDNKAAAQLG